MKMCKWVSRCPSPQNESGLILIKVRPIWCEMIVCLSVPWSQLTRRQNVSTPSRCRVYWRWNVRIIGAYTAVYRLGHLGHVLLMFAGCCSCARICSTESTTRRTWHIQWR